MTDALRPLLARLVSGDEDDGPPGPRTQREWAIDVGLFLMAAGLGTAGLISNAHGGLDGQLLVADAIGGAAVCLALWWRRRVPFLLAVATLPILAISSSATAGGWVLLFTVAARRRWQLAVLVAGLKLVTLPIYHAVHPEDTSMPPVAYFLVGGLGTAALALSGMFVRGRGHAERESARRLQAEELLRIEGARHAERTRIAREMHDVLAHRISLLSLHAGALEFRPDAPPEEIGRAAAVIRASAHQALEDLRDVIGLLRDDGDGDGPQPPQPTLAALPGLLEESRAAGMRVNADVRIPDLGAVPDAIGRHALRIVQEALTNARKHATEATVELLIEGEPGDGLVIEVRNPVLALAAGASQIPGTGTGLVGLAERATLSGGRLAHGLDSAGDFRLQAWLPWPA